MIFIDECAHYCVTYLITYKSDVFSVFWRLHCEKWSLFQSKGFEFICDNGREYLSNEIEDYCVIITIIIMVENNYQLRWKAIV